MQETGYCWVMLDLLIVEDSIWYFSTRIIGMNKFQFLSEISIEVGIFGKSPKFKPIRS